MKPAKSIRSALVVALLLSLTTALSAQVPTFYVQDATAVPGQEVVVNVRGYNLAMIVGVQFSLDWNTDALEFQAVENIVLEGSIPQNFNVSQLDSGRIGYLEFDEALVALLIPDSSILFSLRFRPQMNVGASTSLTFMEAPVNIRASNTMNQRVDIVTEPGFVDLGSLAARDQLAEDPRFTASPNPFHEQLKLSVELPYRSDATLEVLDLNGRLIVSRPVSVRAGTNLINISGQDVPVAGSYLLRLTTDREQLHRKVIRSRSGQ